MAGENQKSYPATQGLAWHRQEYYSFFTPKEWHRFSWTDDRQGDIYGPDPDDSSTVFAVDVKDLGTKVEAEDLDILAEGFFETIEALPEVNIETREQKVTGKILQLEAKYTFAKILKLASVGCGCSITSRARSS